MGSLILLLKFILLSMIIIQIRCSDLETSSVTPSSSTSNASDAVIMHILNNANDTEHNSTKDESNSTINLGEPFGLTIETRSKRESSAEKKLKEDAKNDTETSKASTMTEETIPEMFLEPWGRVRRDEREEECSDAGNPDGSSQNQSSGGSSTNEDVQNESSSDSEGKNLNEAASDDGDDPSNGSSEDSEDASSTNEQDRERRDVGEAEDSFEEGEYRYRTRPYRYREPLRRYWTSHERKPSRNFIRIPIFPGK